MQADRVRVKTGIDDSSTFTSIWNPGRNYVAEI